MLETANYRLLLVMRTLSRITQMAGRSGNELVLNREFFRFRGERVGVPTVSANGLRHAAVREPGGMWLIEAYSLRGILVKEMLRLLTNGGNNASKSGGAENLKRYVEMRERLPLLGLMGCGLPDGPKPGSLRMSPATLLCQETASYAASVLQEIAIDGETLPFSRTCIERWTNYRHDPTQRRPELLADPEEESKHSGMIFGGEAITAGCVLYSEIHLDDATPMELGALLHSLELWCGRGCVVGGMSARGHGRMEAMLWHELDDTAELAEEYRAYALSVRDDALDWLRDTFAKSAKEEKPAKAKAPRKPKPTPAGMFDGDTE